MSSENGGHPLAYVKHFVSGGMGGVCLTLAGQPLDTVKVSANLPNQMNKATMSLLGNGNASRCH